MENFILSFFFLLDNRFAYIQVHGELLLAVRTQTGSDCAKGLGVGQRLEPLVQADGVEEDLAVGIEARDYGICVVQIELKANAARLVLGQVGFAVGAIGKVEKVEHMQEILVRTHVHVPVVDLLAVGASQCVHLFQRSNEVQLHVGGHVRVQGDLEEDLFVCEIGEKIFKIRIVVV